MRSGSSALGLRGSLNAPQAEPPTERTGRNVYVPPSLPPGSPEVRAALTVVSRAASERSAAVYAAYRGAPPRAFIDAVARTFTVCADVSDLAKFLDVDVPEARTAIAAWDRGR